MDRQMAHEELPPTSPESEDSGSTAIDKVKSAIDMAKREDLEQKLLAVRKKKNRHLLWAVLGISPAAIIPAIGLLVEGQGVLLMVLLVLVFLGQVYGWTKTSFEARKLDKELLELSGGANP